MRRAALVAFAIGLSVLAGNLAAQEAYPSRPVRVLIPFAAGGSGDVIGRLISEKLSRIAGQQFVPENRAGATGTIAIETLLNAPRDGYTVVMTTHSPVMIVPNLRKTSYDPARDLVPVALLAENVSGLGVHPSVPAKTFQEFVGYAQANRGKVYYASSGAGSIQHLRNEMLNRAADLGMVHVPYKSAGEAMNDVLAGQIQMIFEAVVFNFARSGQVRLLAVSDERRHPDFPDVPTLKEAGLKDFRFPSWSAAFFATGTPQPIVERLNGLINEALRDPDTKERMWKGGYRALTFTPAETRQLYDRDIGFFRKAITDIGLEKE